MERHLLRTLLTHVNYYNTSRTHQSLDGDAPVSRPTECEPAFDLIAEPVLRGLHNATAARGDLPAHTSAPSSSRRRSVLTAPRFRFQTRAKLASAYGALTTIATRAKTSRSMSGSDFSGRTGHPARDWDYPAHGIRPPYFGNGQQSSITTVVITAGSLGGSAKYTA